MKTLNTTWRVVCGNLWSQLNATLLGLAMLLSNEVVNAADVPWLEEVVTGPRSVSSAEDERLKPLLIDDNGEAIHTLEQWQAKRAQLQAKWLEFLGPMPDRRPEVKIHILGEDREAGCLRQLIEYESEPGEFVQAYLLTPPDPHSQKLPAIVALHPTTNLTISEIAGLQGTEEKHIAVKLASAGFIVICPRNFLWHDAESYEQAVARFRSRHPHTRGMHKMLYDAMRAVDVLQSLPQVDSTRIGCVGHSLGGKEVLYLAAFDKRIRAAVASEAGIGFEFTNWDAPWYLGPAIHADDFPLDHHQLVAMIAPRPFLLLAGESGPGAADGDRSWPYIAAAHPVCELYESPVRLGMLNHRQGHSIPDAAWERVAEWFQTYLANP